MLSDVLSAVTEDLYPMYLILLAEFRAVDSLLKEVQNCHWLNLAHYKITAYQKSTLSLIMWWENKCITWGNYTPKLMWIVDLMELGNYHCTQTWVNMESFDHHTLALMLGRKTDTERSMIVQCGKSHGPKNWREFYYWFWRGGREWFDNCFKVPIWVQDIWP